MRLSLLRLQSCKQDRGYLWWSGGVLPPGPEYLHLSLKRLCSIYNTVSFACQGLFFNCSITSSLSCSVILLHMVICSRVRPQPLHTPLISLHFCIQGDIIILSTSIILIIYVNLKISGYYAIWYEYLDEQNDDPKKN